MDQSTHILISILEESSPLDCNPSTTPLLKNTKLQKDTNASYVDPTNYRSLASKLIFLTNTSPNIYFDVNLANKVHVTTIRNTLESSEVYCFVFEGDP